MPPESLQIQAAAELELRRRKRARQEGIQGQPQIPPVTPQTVQPLPFVTDPSPGAAFPTPEPNIIGRQPFNLAELVSGGFSAAGFDPTTDEQVAAQGLPGEGALARGLGTTGQVLANIVKGGIRTPVEFGAGLIDALDIALREQTIDPIVEQAKGLVKFPKEQVETVGTALGAKRVDPRGRITGINQRTGLVTREPITPTEEEISGARRELREHPEAPIFAALLGRGVGKKIAKEARPKAPPPTEAPITVPEPLRPAEQPPVSRFEREARARVQEPPTPEQKVVGGVFEARPDIREIASDVGLLAEERANRKAFVTKNARVRVQVSKSEFPELREGVFGTVVRPGELATKSGVPSKRALIRHELPSEGITVERFYVIEDVVSAKPLEVISKPPFKKVPPVTPLPKPKKAIVSRETIITKPVEKVTVEPITGVKKEPINAGGIPKKEIAPQETIVKEPAEGVAPRPSKLAEEITGKAPVISEKTISEKGELAAKSESVESGIADLRTFHDATTLSKEGFDRSIQKKVAERFKEIARDKTLGPKVKRVKRKQLKNLMTKLQAEESGIATRETQARNIKGAIRRSGVFVPKEFAEYKNFKEIKGRLSKDPVTAIQEMDGALTAEAKAKLTGQQGPVERLVLRRTQRMMLMRNKFNNDVSATFKKMSKGLSESQRKEAFKVLSKISRTGAKADPARLVKSGEISKITKDPAVVKFAQEARKTFDHLLEIQNEFRRKRNQSTIPRRDFYTPDILKEATIWDKAQFWNKNPREIMTGPDLPDFIKPDKPFNPRELAKKGLLKEFEKVNDLGELLESYANTASRDIFNTSIIQNNKAFAQQLRSMGFESNARYIEDWTAEAFTGVKAGIDRAFQVSNTASKVMTKFRKALNLSVFPLNFAWNITVQTSSSGLTVARYGVKNSAKGAFDWFTNKSLRQEIAKKAYSAVIKQDRASRVTKQDVGVGSSGRIQFKRNKLETAVDAANFFTEWTEKHLTGWSVATGRRKGIELGFKDQALWDYASDAGAKTQSMYNFEDAPAILRNEIVKTAAPFQTFSFTLYNTAKEFAGKTGMPPATFKQRTGMLLRFAAAVSALNYIGSITTGREPWDMRGFVPFYNVLFGVPEQAITGDPTAFGSTRQLPAPTGVAVQFLDGIEELITKGRWDKLRKWLLRFGTGLLGIPGGTQLNKTVEGIITISEGGEFDAAGRMKFPVTEVDDKLIAITMGKWATPGGQAYLDKRANERKKLANAFLKPNPIELLLDEDTEQQAAPIKKLKSRTIRKKTIRKKATRSR